ncbi:AtpZ/AtpI family protein [Campylobacter hepaticus]|uniref:AtpZ/AtpI family protein n=1 Tax=Campylobacter hepaticus TaxID=1813019 RepID=A0A424Z2T1_9BACT|nr:AtpZ/AtpI family protein [Campylobacter hepaticus]MDX2323331.1 AtpZ/AtpI family protein [Campylobacter hepaticus]MDX2331178.1 AtpZ/AtpI family protein [Campylobacter hepaticus]MDX2332591.1 AtpZ/AtpI family protein [Campylobacter hepaticus]MDX2371793.1 AtpZ/AtpI family protein [Campylobacter hepaticus]MDX2397002.1 AtpZ/AtpI family protein [Campylobacter hepaticus]
MNNALKENHTGKKRQKIIRSTLEAAHGLSLGISIIIAILLGIAIGYLLKRFTPYPWLFWLGVFWGIGGAILNVYKAYKNQIQTYEEFSKRDALIQEKIQEEKNQL